jgi:hypothetical protein
MIENDEEYKRLETMRYKKCAYTRCLVCGKGALKLLPDDIVDSSYMELVCFVCTNCGFIHEHSKFYLEDEG